MDLLKINLEGNYSKIGKFTAQKFSYVFERSAHADKILKDKPRKQIIEKSYLERIDNDNLDKSEDKDSIDIFNIDYKNKYNDLMKIQKNKYFNYLHSCSINKQFNNEEIKENPEYERRYRYHLIHHNQLENLKSLNQEDEKLIFLDQNTNNDYLFHKIAYSQSFYKMVGRDDKEKLRKLIEKKLEKKRNKIENKKVNKTYSSGNKKSKNKKKYIKKHIKGIRMEKQLQRGILPEHHDVRIRATKGLDYESKNSDKLIRYMSSSVSSTLLVNKNKYQIKNLKDDKKISRVFSSLLPNNKKNLIIKEKINNNDNIENFGKRIFSGFNSVKNLPIKGLKDHPKSSLTYKDDLLKSGKKEVQFNSDISNNDKTLSSCGFNKIKRDIYSSDKNNDYLFNKNKSNKKRRIFSTPIHNNAISFKKMLSRQYINRVKINDKIGAGLPLTPKYNFIFPKVVMKVQYKKGRNYSKKKEFKGMVGEYLHEVNKGNNTIFKYNTIQQFANFSKMFGRGTKSDSKFPIFMNNINSRNAFDICTEKSLQMNHFSSGKLNNPFSSFNNKKSFNNIITTNNINKINKSKSLDEGINKNNKESRLSYYNNNIDNIFKKVLYDDIVDKNIDNNKDDQKNEDLLDLKKNPQLAKKINLSYKNLISDYYRLNFDYLNKDSIKDKIDGVTFEIIKNKK